MLHSLPPEYFSAHLRVEPSTFSHLVSRLESTAADFFHPPPARPQLSVRVQLALSLFWFGHCGSAASVLLVTQRFGASLGTVVNKTRRVMSAILRWEAEEIRWTTAIERQACARESEKRYGLEGCVGAVDGTTVPFAYAPSVDPWCCFDRHQRYSDDVLIACDSELRITSLVPGITGAVQDTVVQEAAPSHAQPELYYCRPPNYVLGDKHRD